MAAAAEALAAIWRAASPSSSPGLNSASDFSAISVAERADEGLETVAANLPLEGGYENLRSFLADLEAQEQFIVVRQVGLGGGKEGGRNLQLGVVAETYFAAEGRAPGAPPSPPRAPRPEKGAAR